MRHETTVTITAPADLVWRTISTVEKWPEWTPTMDEVSRLDDGELHVGSTARVRQPSQPERTWQVTELAPGRSFTWTSDGPGLHLAADHVIVGEQDGRVEVLLSFEMSGFVAPLANLLSGRKVRQLVDTEAASLTRWCEEHR
ncbi:MAG TPA: SRPBCC family protein [Actinophytocola sp.]|jgi:uncharacterized membrane protein|nr:SRPBCC family protein [Actinophytocola sp.]